VRRKPKIAPTFIEQGLSVVPPTTLLNFFILVMAYGRGVSLIRHARNAQQHSDHRGCYHSKATAAGDEGSGAGGIAHPTNARLMYRAIEKLAALAKREGVLLRQSYQSSARIVSFATFMSQSGYQAGS
jgi:hypothetical protein